jgi:hypothetical protein
MTARWSGVVLGTGGNAGAKGDPKSLLPAGFPTVVGGRSPKVMFRRVLVARNVGCRNGFRGILATCSREGREAQRGHGVERR